MRRVIGEILKSQLKSHWVRKLADSQEELKHVQEQIDELEERKTVLENTITTCKTKLQSNR